MARTIPGSWQLWQEHTGWIDSLDVLLARYGAGQGGVATRLVDRLDLAAHPRAQFAAEIRDQPRILGYHDRARSAVAIISRGVAGLPELSFELEQDRRGAGGGAALVRDAARAVPTHQLLVAAVSPGNTASLRTLLSTGFAPVASVQLFRRSG